MTRRTAAVTAPTAPRTARRTVRRATSRTLLHAALLVALVASAVAGVVMLAGYLVMVVNAVRGELPVPEPSVAQVVLGVLMVLLWGGVIIAGLGALYRQCRRTGALAAWVARTGHAPSSRLVRAAHRAVHGTSSDERVVQVDEDGDDGAAYAFTYGIWNPRIVVSTGLVAATTDDELVAVLRHEDFHRRHRDPLRVLALRTWAAAFFLVPILGTLLQRVLDCQELRADRAAVRACGVPPMAGALLKATGQPTAAPGTALAAMAGPALLEARVTQLETGRSPRLRAEVPPAVVLSSLPGIGLLVGYGVLMYQVCMAVRLCCLT